MRTIADIYVTFPDRRIHIGYVAITSWRIAGRRCFFYDRDAVLTACEARAMQPTATGIDVRRFVPLREYRCAI